MSLNILYTAFTNAFNESKKFLDLKCPKCNYCNNCPFCDLYVNLIAINEWFLEHFKNPTLLTDNIKRNSLLDELKFKNKIRYSYNQHQGYEFSNSYDEKIEISLYHLFLKDLLFLCLDISKDYTYTKIEDENKNIISENNNDIVLIDIGISLIVLRKIKNVKCLINMQLIY